MSAKANVIGKWAKAGIAAIGISALAVPAFTVYAMPVDPTQEPVEEVAVEAAADATLTAEQMEASKALFNQYSCSACHLLGEAGGTGHIGPQLDGNANLDKNYIVNIVSNGQGAMPSFGGMITADDIEQMAVYIMQVKK